MVIEGGLTLIAIAAAFCLPRAGSGFFHRIEGLFRGLARRKRMAVAAVGLAAFFGRLAILPWIPSPRPFVPDDFSYLLAANTFAAGRLTNPTPVMWTHLESLHIDMKPTYMSMYFPAQGLALAAGKVVLGNPWLGVLCTTSLMCAGICWMLQVWLPPGWALLGGLLAVLRIGLFSYWINTYSGGSIAALGGALVLGALPRLTKGARFFDGLLMSAGVILLANSRPYEGLLLCVPVAAMLGRWILSGSRRPMLALLARRAAIPVALMLAAGVSMGYYNHRAFGSWRTEPYQVNRETYAMAPYFVWQSKRPEPAYRHKEMRAFYHRNELDDFNKVHSISGFIPQTFLKFSRGLLFFSGVVFLPLLFMLHRVILDRRIRFLLIGVGILIAGISIEIFLIPHYLAPFTSAFYAIGLQAMRHLRVWRPAGQPVGLAMVRLLVAVCLLLGVVRLYALPLRIAQNKWPASEWTSEWYGPGPFGARRANIEAALDRLPGKQLAIVRYSAGHTPIEEWVYNAPDPDTAKIVWARQMSPADDAELLRYYRDRTVWLVQPDSRPVTVTPFPMRAEEADARP